MRVTHSPNNQQSTTTLQVDHSLNNSSLQAKAFPTLYLSLSQIQIQQPPSEEPVHHVLTPTHKRPDSKAHTHNTTMQLLHTASTTTSYQLEATMFLLQASMPQQLNTTSLLQQPKQHNNNKPLSIFAPPHFFSTTSIATAVPAISSIIIATTTLEPIVVTAPVPVPAAAAATVAPHHDGWHA